MDANGLLAELRKIGFDPTPEQMGQLDRLVELTLSANREFNLTAIDEPGAFYEKMVYDSALGIRDIDLADKDVLDFGTGAGFPGLVIAILSPKARVILLDATKKKTDYLEKLCENLSLDVKVVNARGEEYARANPSTVDLVIGRAVAQLNVFLELSARLVKADGLLLAMKGPHGIDEINAAGKAPEKLGLSLSRVVEDILPECHETRQNIFYLKAKKTPACYPRPYPDIIKKPLK